MMAAVLVAAVASKGWVESHPSVPHYAVRIIADDRAFTAAESGEAFKQAADRIASLATPEDRTSAIVAIVESGALNQARDTNWSPAFRLAEVLSAIPPSAPYDRATVALALADKTIRADRRMVAGIRSVLYGEPTAAKEKVGESIYDLWAEILQSSTTPWEHLKNVQKWGPDEQKWGPGEFGGSATKFNEAVGNLYATAKTDDERSLAYLALRLKSPAGLAQAATILESDSETLAKRPLFFSTLADAAKEYPGELPVDLVSRLEKLALRNLDGGDFVAAPELLAKLGSTAGVLRMQKILQHPTFAGVKLVDAFSAASGKSKADVIRDFDLVGKMLSSESAIPDGGAAYKDILDLGMRHEIRLTPDQLNRMRMIVLKAAETDDTYGSLARRLKGKWRRDVLGKRAVPRLNDAAIWQALPAEEKISTLSTVLDLRPHGR